jgi:hypothetical protein
MHDVLFECVLQGPADLLDNVDRSFNGQDAPLLNQIMNVDAVDELQGHVEISVVFPRTEDRDNVLVGQLCRILSFGLKPFYQLRIRGFLSRQDLQCQLLFLPWVHSQIDRSHAPLPQLPLEFIRTERSPNGQIILRWYFSRIRSIAGRRHQGPQGIREKTATVKPKMKLR